MQNLAIYTRDNFLSGLSFVIPYDKETSAFKAREETAKSWVGKDGTKHVIPNDFVNGYEITACDTRYTTDANHFQIKHPSGFEFQIPAERFFEIVKKYNINKGIIDAELCLSGGVTISDTIRKQTKITMLQKSDGNFTYHLASVIDDMTCGVNLILRGADNLPNTPKHIAIALALQASGFSNNSLPVYGHSGLICINNKKISKRDNASDFSDFMSKYSADAITHWLLQLGWGHPDANFDKNHKTLTRIEMIELFPQGKINFKNCNMNLDKLGNLNKLYNNLKL